MWQGRALGQFDRHDSNDVALESQMNATRDAIRGSWRKCAHT